MCAHSPSFLVSRYLNAGAARAAGGVSAFGASLCLPFLLLWWRLQLLTPLLRTFAGPARSVGRVQAQDERHLLNLAAFLLSSFMLSAEAGDLSHDVLLQSADLLQQRVFVSVLLPALLSEELT